ncbi:MAG: copper resistance protein CopC [Actinomycetota bacterium]
MRLKSSIILTLTLLLALGSPAQAHDQLVDISPPAEAVISENPVELILSFNNPLLVIEGETNAEVSTRLTGEEDWTSHDVSIEGAVLKSTFELSQNGDYEIRWKVVSSDGHPIEGESTFTLKLAMPTPEPSDTGEEVVIAPAPNPEPENSLSGFYFGLALVVLGAVFAPIGLMMRRRAKKS